MQIAEVANRYGVSVDGKIASYQKDGACSEIGDERLRRR